MAWTMKLYTRWPVAEWDLTVSEGFQTQVNSKAVEFINAGRMSDMGLPFPHRSVVSRNPYITQRLFLDQQAVDDWKSFMIPLMAAEGLNAKFSVASVVTP